MFLQFCIANFWCLASVTHFFKILVNIFKTLIPEVITRRKKTRFHLVSKQPASLSGRCTLQKRIFKTLWFSKALLVTFLNSCILFKKEVNLYHSPLELHHWQNVLISVHKFYKPFRRTSSTPFQRMPAISAMKSATTASQTHSTFSNILTSSVICKNAIEVFGKVS